MTVKTQVTMQLFTAGARRTGMHKPHLPALQAALILLGVVALGGVWFGPGRANAAVAGKTYDLWVSIGPGQSPPRCTPAYGSPRPPYKWMAEARKRSR